MKSRKTKNEASLTAISVYIRELVKTYPVTSLLGFAPEK
jgi:hypothetical protein